MTFDQSIVIAAVVVPLALAVAGRLRADVAALLIAVLLGTAQFLGLGILAKPETPSAAVQAFAGFSQPVVVTLISLFVVTRALDKSGVTRAIARRILQIGGASEGRITLLFLMCSVAFSLFMNNVAVGALLLPSAVHAARRSNMKASKLLMPMAFGTLLGGMATYFTTANIIVDNLLQSANPPQPALNILDFTPTGGLITVLGITFIATLGRRLLPERAPLSEQMLPSRTGSELEDVYQLGERLWEARVVRHSPHVGRTLAQTRIGERFGVSVIALWHGRQAIFSPTATHAIYPEDVLLMIGRQDRVQKLADEGFIIGRQGRDDHHISEMGVSFIEVTLAPHSRAVGKTLKELEFRKLYNYTAVALWREGISYRTDVADFTLKPGDSFLVIGPLASLRRLRTSRDFIALESDLSDQPLETRSASIALGITGVAIAVSILGFPVSVAMMAAAVLIVIFGLISTEEAYRSIEWQAIFLVAGMYSISIAMVQTGLAPLIGRGIVSVAEPFGGLGLAAGSFLLSALLTQFMGGQVTALVTGPIAISAAISLNTNPQAIAIATAIGCSASFLTPLAHPINILMMGPGNYTFADFPRLGIPVMIIAFIGLMGAMVLFWGL